MNLFLFYKLIGSRSTVVIEEMEKCYGDRSGVADSPLHGMTAIELKEQLSYLRTQWNH